MESGCEVITLRRRDSGQQWGFRLVGGQDQGCPLYIAKVSGFCLERVSRARGV